MLVQICGRMTQVLTWLAVKKIASPCQNMESRGVCISAYVTLISKIPGPYYVVFGSQRSQDPQCRRKGGCQISMCSQVWYGNFLLADQSMDPATRL